MKFRSEAKIIQTRRLSLTKIFFAGMIFALTFSFVQIVSAQEMKYGEINWVQGYISAIGNGTADPAAIMLKTD